MAVILGFISMLFIVGVICICVEVILCVGAFVLMCLVIAFAIGFFTFYAWPSSLILLSAAVLILFVVAKIFDSESNGFFRLLLGAASLFCIVNYYDFIIEWFKCGWDSINF